MIIIWDPFLQKGCVWKEKCISETTKQLTKLLAGYRSTLALFFPPAGWLFKQSWFLQNPLHVALRKLNKKLQLRYRLMVYWLVVEPYPSEKWSESQWWWNSQYDGKVIQNAMVPVTTNQKWSFFLGQSSINGETINHIWATYLKSRDHPTMVNNPGNRPLFRGWFHLQMGLSINGQFHL